MKDDVISRQEAINALNKLDVSDGVGISSIACDLQEKAICSIENLPSAQPERRTGVWSINFYPATGLFRYKCSECNAVHRARHDFCPSCGADMRGEQDGSER